MGVFSKAKSIVKKPRKLIKKLIPKEIRPFLPYIAAATPGLQGYAAGVFANPAAQKALIAGLTRFATDDEADLKDVGITAALAASPDLLKSGGEGIGAKYGSGVGSAAGGDFTKTQQFADMISKGASKIPTLGETGSTLGTQAKLVGGLGAVDATRKLAEINQDALDEYNRKLAEQGITDAKERRARIRDIYLGVGYDEDYVDGLLDRYGYKAGGVTYTMEDILDMAGDLTKKKRKDKEEEDEDELGYFLEQGQRGLMSLMPKQKPVPIRPLTMAEGGLMNLGGNEMALRGGGFVPIGKKEKADDVPARLSKNEFVMTADAVRGAGGGDVNEGARRMYQTMDKLEAMA